MSTTVQATWKLRCDECGNKDRFVEFMQHEIHLVNGDLVYLRLLEAEVERYECYYCGNLVEALPNGTEA